MPSFKNRRRGRYQNSSPQDTARAGLVDDINEFNKFREEILPVLRKALNQGLSAEEIYTKFQSYAAARAVSIAATEEDSGKALSAIKDILDRTQGRAKEKVDITHKMASLPEEQLDALLLSKLKGSNITDSDSDPTEH